MAFADELVLKQGLVWKRSGKRLVGWKRKFVVLRPSSLSYSQSSSSAVKKPSARYIELTQSSVLVLQPKKHQYALEVSSGSGGRLVLRTDTLEEFESWRNAIEDAIRHAAVWPTIKLALVGGKLHFDRFVAKLPFPPKPHLPGEANLNALEIILEVDKEWVRLVVFPQDAQEEVVPCDVVLIVVENQDQVPKLVFSAAAASNKSLPVMLVRCLPGENADFQQNVDRAETLEFGNGMATCQAYCETSTEEEFAQVFVDCAGLVMANAARAAAASASQQQRPQSLMRHASSKISLLAWAQSPSTRKAVSQSSAKLEDSVHNGSVQQDEETAQGSQHGTEEEEEEEEEEDEDEDDDAGSVVSVEMDETQAAQPLPDFTMAGEMDVQYSAKLLHKQQQRVQSYRKKTNASQDLHDIEETDAEQAVFEREDRVMVARKTMASFLRKHNQLVGEQLLAMRRERQLQQRVLHETKPVRELGFLQELKAQRRQFPPAAAAAAMVREEEKEEEIHKRGARAFQNRARVNAVFF